MMSWPEYANFCEAIRLYMRRSVGVDCDWHIQAHNLEMHLGRVETIHDMRGLVERVPVSGDTYKVSMEFVGARRPEGTPETTSLEAPALLDQLDTLRQDLARETALRERLAAQLSEQQDEESQLIRRIVAKTRLKHGVDHKGILLDFLEWFMDKGGVELDHEEWSRCWREITAAPVSELKPGFIIDQFLGAIQKPQADAMLPPNNNGGDDHV